MAPRTPPPNSRVLYRPALACALAFLDAAQQDALDARALTAWFESHLVRQGVVSVPATVQEPGVGVASLRDFPTGGAAPAFEERVRSIVRAARLRVSLALQGLVAAPADDRFLTSAIFADRVVREVQWRPKLKGTERLSDIVLTVLAADILTHRDEYDASLCVCAICGHVALSRTVKQRTRCAVHAQAQPEPQSG
jgi:hypothetical protein